MLAQLVQRILACFFLDEFRVWSRCGCRGTNLDPQMGSAGVISSMARLCYSMKTVYVTSLIFDLEARRTACVDCRKSRKKNPLMEENKSDPVVRTLRRQNDLRFTVPISVFFTPLGLFVSLKTLIV
jgi:hypothetical protein